MTAVIIPGSHQNNFEPMFPIKGSKKIKMTWDAIIANEGEGPGWYDWWIEFKHDRGFPWPDLTWVEYAPGWPVKMNPYDKGSGGLKPIATGMLPNPELKEFAAVGGVGVHPGKSVPIAPGERKLINGELTIPGPGHSPKAAEFWRFMETSGRDDQVWNFHLTVDLISQKEQGAYYAGGKAETVARHRWENIFSVPAPDQPFFRLRQTYRT